MTVRTPILFKYSLGDTKTLSYCTHGGVMQACRKQFSVGPVEGSLNGVGTVEVKSVHSC